MNTLYNCNIVKDYFIDNEILKLRSFCCNILLQSAVSQIEIEISPKINSLKLLDEKKFLLMKILFIKHSNSINEKIALEIDLDGDAKFIYPSGQYVESVKNHIKFDHHFDLDAIKKEKNPFLKRFRVLLSDIKKKQVFERGL